MNKPLAIGVGLLLLVLLILFSTTYSVSFYEVAIRKTFGQSTEDSVVDEAGLHFKLPIFADQVTKYDTRLQLLESPAQTVPTADGQQVIVRAFLLWQVDRAGALTFDQSYRSLDGAAQTINDRFRTAISAGVSRYRFNDLIGSGSRLQEAEEAIRAELQSLEETGLLPRTVGISQILLPPRTTSAVLSRMDATRSTLAEAERFKGNAEAERIESEARTSADRILNFASQRAEEIRAAGNQEAAKYLQQMAQDEEFAIFLTYLDALEATLSQYTTAVLETNVAPWHLMNLATRTNANGLPQPERTLGTSQEQAAANDLDTDEERDDSADASEAETPSDAIVEGGQ